jgi:hypothetical protein
MLVSVQHNEEAKASQLEEEAPSVEAALTSFVLDK